MASREAGQVAAEIESICLEATRLLVEAAHPDRIILFGSHARGDFTPDSDLDLLVILSEVDDRIAEMIRLRRVLRNVPMPIDMVVYSRKDVEERQHLRGTMLYHALRDGKVLHEAS